MTARQNMEKYKAIRQLLYLHTGNLWCPIQVHMIVNSLNFISVLSSSTTWPGLNDAETAFQTHSCLIKRRPTAAHCAQSRALPHTLSRRSLVRRRMHPPTGNRQFRAQLFKAGKSDKITFSKIKFFTLKNRVNTCFLINYGISVHYFWFHLLKKLKKMVY